MARLTEKKIAAYGAAGFKRWTKNGYDRLYINVTRLGLEISRYNTGNISHAEWCGKVISNSDGYRMLSSKVWVDVETGELHVKDCTRIESPSLEDKASELVATIEKEA